MSSAIARQSKIKGNPTGVQRHNQRENKNYTNKEINQERSHLNYSLLESSKINFNAEADRVIKESGYTRKIRDNQIKAVEVLFTSSYESMELMGEEQRKKYFRTCLDFAKKEFGEKNIISAIVHNDEKTPHLHLVYVPMTKDNRLSAKEVVGNKYDLIAFQDRFFEHLKERNYDKIFERSKSDRKHIPIEEYKKITDYAPTKAIEIAKTETIKNVKAQKKWFGSKMNISQEQLSILTIEKPQERKIENLIDENYKIKGKLQQSEERANSLQIELNSQQKLTQSEKFKFEKERGKVERLERDFEKLKKEFSEFREAMYHSLGTGVINKYEQIYHEYKKTQVKQKETPKKEVTSTLSFIKKSKGMER